MTTHELIATLNALDKGDAEAAHITAEALLLTWLTEVGYGDVATAYIAARDTVGFWYA